MGEGIRPLKMVPTIGCIFQQVKSPPADHKKEYRFKPLMSWLQFINLEATSIFASAVSDQSASELPVGDTVVRSRAASFQGLGREEHHLTLMRTIF